MKSLLLCSGGMDSVTLLYEQARDIDAIVSFHYGSKHNDQELKYAKIHAQRLHKEHIVIPLVFIADLFQSALLQTGEAIPDGHYEDVIMRKTVVPFRNGIMLAIAAGLAESRGLQSVSLANHAGDHAIYPDCRPAFITPMAEAIKQGTYAQVELVSPYVSLTKRDIALIGRCCGVNYAETWSCYKGGAIHCGTCGTCVERKEALAGFDPTNYVDNSKDV